jgi:hypothetical protein
MKIHETQEMLIDAVTTLAEALAYVDKGEFGNEGVDALAWVMVGLSELSLEFSDSTHGVSLFVNIRDIWINFLRYLA